MASEIPRVEFSISLEPTIYSYKSSEPPKFIVNAIYRPSSDVKDPSKSITVLTWNSILDKAHILYQKKHRITDLSESPPKVVDQSTATNCRAGPIKRLQNSTDAEYFLTLEPNVTTQVSGVFSCHPEGVGPPLPWGDERRLSNRGKQRRPLGIDGLEIGHRYSFEIVVGSEISWWRWGTKNEVLDSDGNGELGKSDGEKVVLEGIQGETIVEFEVEE